MKTCLTGLTIITLSCAAPALLAADLSGKATLKGPPKAETPIDLGPTCGKINQNKPTTRHFVVGKDGGLANVFVYVKNAPKGPAKGESPLLDQVGCMYEPYVFGVVTGQKFKVKNSDPEMHNVHSTPKPVSGNKEFNFAQPAGAPISEKSFDNAEILLRIKCDVHPWMFSYVGVVEHPYFAVTDKDGNFKISGLPDGNYTVVAYHLKSHGLKEGVTQEIEVKGSATANFTVEAPAP